MNWIKRLFKRNPRVKEFNGEYATEVFRHNGKVYFAFTDTFRIPAGRALCALAIYEELRMRCDREYLEKHIRATELILSPDRKRIDLAALALINNNLKERLNLAPYPDHIYKLASVMFFDQSESPYKYDFVYNQKKIDEWKADPGMLDFFLRTHFKDLMPSLPSSGINADTYFQVAEKVNKLHRQQLSDIISSKN
jgi:hypothetical protein